MCDLNSNLIWTKTNNLYMFNTKNITVMLLLVNVLLRIDMRLGYVQPLSVLLVI